MYVDNTTILELRFLAKNITSDYGYLLQLVNTFTVATEEYPLLKYMTLNFVLTNHMYVYSKLAHLK